MTMAFEMLVDKHAKAAKSLLRFVKNKTYQRCDLSEMKLLHLQLKANIIISEDWVPFYKEVDEYFNRKFPKTIKKGQANESTESVKEMVE